MAPPSTFVYVSSAESGELTVLWLDVEAGRLMTVQNLPLGGQVMPLAVSPDRRFLYAAIRSQPHAVLSFAIDAQSGRLARIGSAPLPDSMAHVVTDRTGRWLFAASYGGDKLSLSPIDADGVVRAPLHVLPTGRHAHAVLVDPSNRYVFVSNLGVDRVMQWRFDAHTGRLWPNDPPHLQGRPRSGPRHFALHPDGRHAYLLNELDATVETLSLDGDTGTLQSLQWLDALPPGFDGKPWAADIHVTPDGRFVYTSERSSSTIACFAADPSTRLLRRVAHTPTQAQPRGFNIDPSGKYMVVAGELSHALTLYGIDPADGRLQTLQECAMGCKPNWVEMVSPPGRRVSR